jgi:hypothetical protein
VLPAWRVQHRRQSERALALLHFWLGMLSNRPRKL